MPGERQREQDRGDLIQGEPLRVLLVDGDQVAGHVVARPGFLGVHQIAQVLAIGGHAGRDLHLVPGRRAPPAERGPVPAPVLELLVIPVRHSHQGEHDGGGQREGERGYQVELVLPGHAVEQAPGGGLDGGDHRGDPLHAERAGGGLAEPGVLGLVQADHRRLRRWPPASRICCASGTSGTSGACATAAE